MLKHPKHYPRTNCTSGVQKKYAQHSDRLMEGVECSGQLVTSGLSDNSWRHCGTKWGGVEGMMLTILISKSLVKCVMQG